MGKKKNARETKNRAPQKKSHFTNRQTGVDRFFPSFCAFAKKATEKIPFLAAIFPISFGAFPPRTRSLAFHETPESTWKRVQMSETAERLFSHRHSF